MDSDLKKDVSSDNINSHERSLSTNEDGNDKENGENSNDDKQSD